MQHGIVRNGLTHQWDAEAIGGNGRPDYGRRSIATALLKMERYCSLAYSALASFRMGMSGSASFQRARKSWYAVFALVVSSCMAYALPSCRCASAPSG